MRAICRAQGRHHEAVRLARPGMVEGPKADRVGAVMGHLSDHDIRCGLRCPVDVARLQRGRLVQRGGGTEKAAAIDFRAADEDEAGARRLRQDRTGDVQRAHHVHTPGVLGISTRLCGRRDRRQMQHHVGRDIADRLHHGVCLEDIEAGSLGVRAARSQREHLDRTRAKLARPPGEPRADKATTARYGDTYDSRCVRQVRYPEVVRPLVHEVSDLTASDQRRPSRRSSRRA